MGDGLRFHAVVADKMILARQEMARRETEPKARYQENSVYDGLIRELYGKFHRLADRFHISLARRGKSDRVDQKIGDPIATLKKQGDFENTLILFLSDNGACAEMSLTGCGEPIADRAPEVDLVNPSYGKSWANASATPYRLYKHYGKRGQGKRGQRGNGVRVQILTESAVAC